MEKQIEEIKNYFKSKILAGDFTVVRVEKIVVEILIDEMFTFNLWAHTNYNFEQYEHLPNFMMLDVFTKEEQVKAFAIFNPIKAQAEAEAETKKLDTSKIKKLDITYMMKMIKFSAWRDYERQLNELSKDGWQVDGTVRIEMSGFSSTQRHFIRFKKSN